MSSTSTQTVEIPRQEPRQRYPAENPQPLVQPKTKKPRFSITLVGAVPL